MLWSVKAEGPIGGGQKGVCRRPRASPAPTGALPFSSSLRQSSWPWSAAQCRAVFPSAALASKWPLGGGGCREVPGEKQAGKGGGWPKSQGKRGQVDKEGVGTSEAADGR